jgi:CubicO group peptidase (beta-lactamase class C family)
MQVAARALAAFALFLTIPAAGHAAPLACGGDAVAVGQDCVAKAQVAARIEEIVRKAMAEKHLKSVIAGVAVDGQPILTEAWGESMTGVPATANMHLRNGAVAIAYLGIVALQLQEKGVLSLDDKLSKWFPDYPKADRITLAMLLHGTSGYADYVNLKILPLYENPFRNWQPDELIALAFKEPMACEPGACWSYAHTNFVILGQVLEKASGRSVAELIRDGILTPLSLNDTRSEQTALMQEPVLHAFDAERGIYEDSTYWNPSWTLARGAVMTSNIPDILKSATAIGTRRLALAGELQAAARAGHGQVQTLERQEILWPWRVRHWRLAVAEPLIRRLRGDHGLSAGAEARHRRLGDDGGEGTGRGQPLHAYYQGDRGLSGPRSSAGVRARATI